MVSTNTHPCTLLAKKKYTVSLRFPVCAILQCCAWSAQIHTPVPFWLKKIHSVTKVPSVRNIGMFAHGQHKYTPLYPFGSKKIHSVTKVPSVRNIGMFAHGQHKHTPLYPFG